MCRDISTFFVLFNLVGAPVFRTAISLLVQQFSVFIGNVQFTE